MSTGSKQTFVEFFLLKTEVGDCDDLHREDEEECTVPNFMIVATVFKWPQICHML